MNRRRRNAARKRRMARGISYYEYISIHLEKIRDKLGSVIMYKFPIIKDDRIIK